MSVERCPKCRRPIGRGLMFPSDPTAPGRTFVCHDCYWTMPEPPARAKLGGYAPDWLILQYGYLITPQERDLWRMEAAAARGPGAVKKVAAKNAQKKARKAREGKKSQALEAKREARRVQEATEKAMREELSRQNKAKGFPPREKPPKPAPVPTPSMNIIPPPGKHSLSDAAARLGVTLATLSHACSLERIPCERKGRFVYVILDDASMYVASAKSRQREGITKYWAERKRGKVPA